MADVTARDRIAGGIAGGTYNLTIENCYYGGDVLAKNYAGGIAGVMDSTSGSSTTVSYTHLAKVQSVEAAAVGAKVNVEIGGKVDVYKRQVSGLC